MDQRKKNILDNKGENIYNVYPNHQTELLKKQYNQNALYTNNNLNDNPISTRMLYKNNNNYTPNENPYQLSNNKGAFNYITDPQDINKIHGYNRNYSNNIGYNQGGINQQTFKSRSHQIFSSLLMRNKFHKILMPGKEVNYDSLLRIPEELANVNCSYWIERYQEFLVNTLLEDFINEHDNNIININKTLEFTNIQLIPTLPDEDPMNIEEQLQNKFNDNSLIRRLENPQLAFNKDNNLSNTIKIFFGDNRTINQIIQFIEYKLRLSKQNEKEYRQNKDKKEPYFDKTDKFIYELIKKKNPFLKKELNYDYNDLMTKNQLQLEESYITLKHYLIYRILLNEKLYAKLFVNPINEKHSHLLIEYNIGRLRELKASITQYKNNSGGKFFTENWCSIFPSDSQLIAYITIQFIEDIYNNNYQKKLFLISFPLAPKLEKDSNNLYIYQTNPEDTEPYFYVVYQDMIINCDEKDNFFHAFVVFLYLMKVKNPQIIQTLNLGEFIKKIIQ